MNIAGKLDLELRINKFSFKTPADMIKGSCLYICNKKLA